MATANIKITIPAFTTPFSAPGSGATVSIANCIPTNMVMTSGPADRVSVTPPTGSGAGYVPGSITVTGKKSVRLAFSVVDAGGARYAECGLVFTTGTVNAGGTDNFPDFIVDDDGLLVTDSAGFSGSYSFLLLVQNSVFGMGLIDPKIINVP